MTLTQSSGLGHSPLNFDGGVQIPEHRPPASPAFADANVPIAESFRGHHGDAVEASKAFVAAANRLPTLFDLEDTGLRLMALAEMVDDPEAIAEVEDQLALVDQMLMEKTESYVSVIRSLEAMAVARKVEADRLRDRAKTAERHADWLRARLLAHMQTTGRARIETARFALSIKQNPTSCVVTDETLVPREFVRTVITTTVDKTAIKTHCKTTGEVVPGVELVRTESLSIR